MIKTSVFFDEGRFGGYERLLKFALKKNLPHLNKAVKESVKLFEETWIGFAKGGTVPGRKFKILHPGSGQKSYWKRIYSKSQRAGGENFGKVWTDAPQAGLLEEGREKALDLKPFFKKSRSARRNASGQWYLIIPLKDPWTTSEPKFLTVNAKSKGWIVKRYPKKSIFKSAVRLTQGKIRRKLEKAVLKDFETARKFPG